MTRFRTVAAILAALAIIRGWQKVERATRPAVIGRCATCPHRATAPRSLP